MGKLEFKRWPVWRSILTEAWTAALDDVQFIKGWGLMVPVLLFAIYVALVWQFVGTDAAGGEVIDKLLVIAAPLLALPLCYFVRLIQTIADREISLGSRVLRLKERLTPRFKIEPSTLEFGLRPRVAMVGGKPQNIMYEKAEFMCLAVTNISENQSDICAAQIIEMVGDNGAKIVDPIELQWLGPSGDGDQHYATIPSMATKTAKVLRLHDGSLPSFNMQVVPAHLTSLFKGATKFTGKIAFDDRYYGGQMLHFILNLMPQPALEIVHSETFRVKYQRDIEDDEP